MSHVFDVGAFSDSEEEGVAPLREEGVAPPGEEGPPTPGEEDRAWKRKAEKQDEGRGGKAGRYQQSCPGNYFLDLYPLTFQPYLQVLQSPPGRLGPGPAASQGGSRR